MPRAPRADEAGGLYHALNRGNLRADIFRKDADFSAFERILHEGLKTSKGSGPIVFGTDVAWDLRRFPRKKNTNLWHAFCASTMQ